jgi:hypothetical protein
MAAKRKHPELEMQCDGRGGDLFVILDGVKIAVRGAPGTPQAGLWISLEPGYTVHMTETEVVVEHDKPRLH